MGVYHVELNPFGDRMPFEIEQRVKIASLLPSVVSQLKTSFHNLGVVARADDVFEFLVVLFVLQRILMVLFFSFDFKLDHPFLLESRLFNRVDDRPARPKRVVVLCVRKGIVDLGNFVVEILLV